MTQGSAEAGGAAAGVNAHGARSLKDKAVDEFRQFLVLFFYLWILFGVFVVNQGVVLREHGFNFTLQGFAFINALVFAKVRCSTPAAGCGSDRSSTRSSTRLCSSRFSSLSLM